MKPTRNLDRKLAAGVEKLQAMLQEPMTPAHKAVTFALLDQCQAWQEEQWDRIVSKTANQACR